MMILLTSIMMGGDGSDPMASKFPQSERISNPVIIPKVFITVSKPFKI